MGIAFIALAILFFVLAVIAMKLADKPNRRR